MGNVFQAGDYDFFSTAVHELTHALGFASAINQDGTDSYSHALGAAGTWSLFDKYLTDFNGATLINGSYELDVAKWNLSKLSLDNSGGTSGCSAGLLFTGTNAMAANSGQAVQIYSPNPWEGGSSGSHLDDACYTSPGDVSTYMMEAQTISGLGVRTLSAMEVGFMQDIGYTYFRAPTPTNGGGTVPEPGTIYLALGALGLMGLMRRNKKAS